MTGDVPTLANDVAKAKKKRCANCGHDVVIYHHPLGSGGLAFHNNGGVLALACACGCKNPEIKV